ncbi:phospholipase D-like domain-containing protein [Microbacterium sp. SS28]|uniref:phospholipase D-like domain-containing protein n=1 Tax=Microbacterium sp. SS28 TaxID=2919948 RepID=UPI001FA9DE8B|nr:phospholipase D-like domain-containing protein [Microbacterium sp. SS28]
MRRQATRDGVTVQAIAGTHAVLLGIDVAGLDQLDALGFAIRRLDHVEEEQYWLRGMKVFRSVVPDPAPGENYSLRYHPVQGFQWGDYSAKPGRKYTYRVAVVHGPASAPTLGARVDVTVTTEREDDGRHGVWFNRGVAGSQAWNAKFGVPSDELKDPNSSAWAWLSRGLGEAFLSTVATAVDGTWSLHGAFYEFTWSPALLAFGLAASRGADVQLVVHGRDKDPDGADADDDVTAARNRAAAEAAGLNPLVTWRVAPNKGALQHNKFLVLSHNGTPVAVWTGSTNLTQGAIYGHSNVGHLIHDPAVAAAFLAYWQQLQAATTTAQLRTWAEANNPLPAPLPVPVFSPRRTGSDLLEVYADLFDGATSSVHLTGAFGLNAVFRARLGIPRDYPRTVLLDKQPPYKTRIPHDDPNVRIVWGAHLTSQLEQWATERLTGFNGHVPYIHLKTILIDPLTDRPALLTGSANYSEASTEDNEENTLVLQTGGTGVTSAKAMKRISDIYLTEYHRLFMHHVFRAFGQPPMTGVVSGGDRGLKEDNTWIAPHLAGWRARQRHLFAGTSA